VVELDLLLEIVRAAVEVGKEVRMLARSTLVGVVIFLDMGMITPIWAEVWAWVCRSGNCHG
jgi:hypothetical protein